MIFVGRSLLQRSKKNYPFLDDLYTRGLQNELDIQRIGVDELKEIEPHVNGLGAIRVPQAGIVNYRQVSEKFAGYHPRQWRRDYA